MISITFARFDPNSQSAVIKTATGKLVIGAENIFSISNRDARSYSSTKEAEDNDQFTDHQTSRQDEQDVEGYSRACPALNDIQINRGKINNSEHGVRART
jgi:hypothetical protein